MSGSPATGNISTSLQTGVGNDYQLMGTDMNTPLKQQQPEGHGRGHHPRLSLGNVIVAEDEPAVGQFSFMVALAFCCNYCMGTGFLTLPWAFAQVGYVLGVLCLALTAFMCNIAKDYLIEVMARAEAIEYPEEANEEEPDGTGAVNGHGEAQGGGFRGLAGPSLARADSALLRDGKSLTVRHRKFEVPVLCEIFLGHKGKVCYLACLCVYIYGALWAYGSVFASACAATLPVPHLHDSYPLYLALFALLVWPLSCLELTEQVAIQSALACCRILMVVLMVATTLTAYDPNKHDFPDQSGAIGIPAFDATHLYRFLPVSVYAFIYHHSIPGLSHPVRDKKQLGNIFLLTFVMCAVSYASMGLVVSWFFGPTIPSSSNLAWTHYRGAGGGAAAELISKYILLFPALDVASAFPLNAITLGNNMMATLYGDEVLTQPLRRGVVVRYRLLAACPPVLGALFMRNLGTITDWSGTAGFIITFIFPALLQLSSRKMMKDVFQVDSAKVFYSNQFSRKASAPVVLLLGVAMFVYVSINLLIAEAKEGVA